MKIHELLVIALLFISTNLFGQRKEWNVDKVNNVEIDYYSPSHPNPQPFKTQISFRGENTGDLKKYLYLLRFYEVPNANFVNRVIESRSQYLIEYYLPFSDFDYYRSFYDRGRESLNIFYFKDENTEYLKFTQENQ